MPLATQPLEIILTGGINTSIDEKLLPQGSLLELTKVFYTKYVKISKRPGYSYLTNQTTVIGRNSDNLVTPKNIYSHNTSLIADAIDEASDRKLFDYSPALGKWIPRDKVSEAVVETHSVVRSQRLYDDTAVACIGNFLLYVWQDGTSIRAQLVDATTRAYIKTWLSVCNDYSCNAFAFPQIIVYDNAFYLFFRAYSDTFGEHVILKILDTDDLSSDFSADIQVQTMGAYLPFAVDTAGNGNFVIAYGATVSDGYEGVKICQRALTAPAVNTYSYDDTTPAGAVSYIAITGPANEKCPNHTFVAWAATIRVDKVVYVRELNSTMTVTHGTTIANPDLSILAVDLLVWSPTAVLVSYVMEQSYTEPATYFRNFYWVAGTQSDEGSMFNVSQHSRMFQGPNGKYYFIGHTLGAKPATLSYPDSSYFLFDLDLSAANPVPLAGSTLRPVAVMVPRLAGAGRISVCLAPVVANGSRMETIMAVGINRPAYGSNGGFDAFSICFEDTFQSSNMGNLTGISGGFLQQYDSNSLVETNFFRMPTGASAVISSGTGLGLGTYYYKIVFEWRDKYGNLYQSAPSTETLSVVSEGSNNSATLTIPNLTITHKHTQSNQENPVVIVIYRTEVNGTIYKRLYSYENTPETLKNVYSVGYTIYEDSLEDQYLGEPLYTTGGRLENVCPPSTRFAIQHKRRLWLVSAEDPTTLWFSQEMIEGETPGFHETLTINMPYDGAIIGLGSFDDKLVVFKEGSIWAIFGEGPADNGTNSDLSSPILVTRDVGCIDRRSIVNAFGGIYFQGAKGIYRINSGLQVDFVGAAIESTLAPYVTSTSVAPVYISSACYVPFMNQVRFCLEGGNYTNASILVYDTIRNVWSQWDYYDAYVTGTGISTVCVDGYYYLATDSKLLYSVTNSFKDQIGAWGGSTTTWAYIPLTVTTPWIRIGALQGFQRIQRVMGMLESVGPHNIYMSLYYNYIEDGYATAEFWAYDNISAFNRFPLEQIETHVPHQKCQSIKVKFYDSRWTAAPEGTDAYNSAGYTISALTLLAGVKRGLDKRGYSYKH
jgi:hypothetical protein